MFQGHSEKELCDGCENKLEHIFDKCRPVKMMKKDFKDGVAVPIYFCALRILKESQDEHRDK